MRCKPFRTAALFLAIAVMPAMLSAEPPRESSDAPTSSSGIRGRQQMVTLPVRVVDPAGNPVAGVKVFPWALRSSQGHGPWDTDPEERAQIAPEEVVTDAAGTATVLCPRLRDVAEGVQTIGVSLQVDHPEFAFSSDIHVELPLEQSEPYEIKLGAGVPVVIKPDWENADNAPGELVALWSDGRSWQPGASAEKLADGSLRIPALPLGKNSVLLVNLDGKRATHFSPITDFELHEGENEPMVVPLRSAIRVSGRLSDNVARPVKAGRVKVETLPPSAGDYDRVMWFTWAPVAEDGTFVVESWPAGEPMQLIALCDGYMAKSGQAPAVVESPRNPDPYNRPEVFAVFNEPIEIAMEPLQPCIVRTVDEDDVAVAGIRVVSGPNVGWWNHGSQIYCDPLIRGETFLRRRDYFAAVDDDFPQPFQAETNAAGEATLHLPLGSEDLYVKSEVYELPAFLGRRSVEVKLVADQPASATLRLQPRGTDKLGEWDKLAGVVFGCTTREGRRICALPGVQKKMEEFTRRFREAKDRQDPQLLADVYAAVADAFKDAGDFEQSILWRRKSNEQAAKVKVTSEHAPTTATP